jgi:RNA polymerase sigma-70 factor (ECF subfamily)
MGLILAEAGNSLQTHTFTGIERPRDNGATLAIRSKRKMDRAEILTRLRERIVRYAASQLQGSSTGDQAQDLAQEVLIVLHEKYSDLDRTEDLLPVSLEIARLKIWAARRKSRRRGEDRQVPVDEMPLASGEVDPFEQASRRERVARLESALSGLGERCRELFRLKLEGYTFPEIQTQLKVSTLNTLYTWDFRCRKQLLERLGGNWDQP